MDESLKKSQNTKNRKEEGRKPLVREIHIRKTTFLAIEKKRTGVY